MVEYHWYTSPVILGAIVIACVLQLLIARKLPEGLHTLRVHAGFALFGLFLTALGHWLPELSPEKGVDVLAEMAKLGWGILFIRILCMYIFRIVMPALGAGRPRILHEIVFVLACVAWGLVRLRSAGLNLGGIVTTSAAITAIIAFSMQETLGNILGGVALQLDKSVHIGDWIQVDNVRGKVVEVSWRHTAVLTPNGEVVVIPNSLLMKSKMTLISNEEYPIARRTVGFSTLDTVPPQEVIVAIEKALRGTEMKHVAHAPAPDCVVTDYVGGSTHFAVRYWLIDQLHDATADSTVRLHIYSVLRRSEFALARPVMNVHMDGEAQERSAQREDEIAQRVQLLSGVPLFASLHVDELHSLATHLRVTPFMKNDVMTRQGAVAHWLYVLTSGEADVWYETHTGDRRFVATLEAGALFGEMGMMTGEPRRATVAARTDAVCFRIDKESFEGILAARPELAGDLAQVINSRSSVLDAIRLEDQAAPRDDDARLLAKIRRFFKLPQPVLSHED